MVIKEVRRQKVYLETTEINILNAQKATMIYNQSENLETPNYLQPTKLMTTAKRTYPTAAGASTANKAEV
jgi:hypothetical protein